MARPVTLFTGQWADLPLEEMAKKAKDFGYDGLELACWGDHFDVVKGAESKAYCEDRLALLDKYGLKVWAISNHLAGQAVCDRIDERHKAILPPHVWGDGDPEGVRERAAEEMKRTAKAASNLGVKVVNGFTGSSIWHLVYFFPPVDPEMVEAGFRDFAERWRPILDTFAENGVKFALEVHPTEIAYDIYTAERALEAIGGHEAFGFNFDPSHLHWQGVDPVKFIRKFGDRIYHVHMKDAIVTLDGESGILSSHLPFGDSKRGWDFRSLGRGGVNFEEIIRALNAIGYQGPLSVEWEDSGMDREHGAKEACEFVRKLDFEPSKVAFEAAFAEK
ncbi:MAG: sugar phosphate isomerase/epimerase [Candidatus Latescibacterota bacterium]|nr:MAG: sugar phosphate isomerase/epimerase [Candidatus Latescibacterota bacterium]RKY72852.1 MAG: sugar phosphate isomerase/epimerase [Candidatus Latescibacterota bacterium]